MRAVFSLLALCVLSLFFYQWNADIQAPATPRERAQDLDISILSQGAKRRAPCRSGQRLAYPGLLVGDRFWPSLRKRDGGLAAGRISATGQCRGVRYFELRVPSNEKLELEALGRFIEGTQPGSHLALMATATLASGPSAPAALAEVLLRLGAREHPTEQPGASWALLTTRMPDGSWSARGELLNPSGCVELWRSLAVR